MKNRRNVKNSLGKLKYSYKQGIYEEDFYYEREEKRSKRKNGFRENDSSNQGY